MADSVYPSVKSSDRKNDLVIRGRVRDSKRKEPLAYVNVGIPDKNIGTVTQKDGVFAIRLGQELKEDSIRISKAGYDSRTYSIAILLQKKMIDIFLNERVVELKEVVVTAKAIKTKKIGNTTTSKFVSIGLPLRFLGSETGIKIRLGKNPMLLKSFTFNISDNRLDTAVFRMNIYNLKNGTPFENILQHNIIIPVGKQTGLYRVNLIDYKLVLKGALLVSLEWIEGSYSGSEKGVIFLSAAFLNSPTWHRLTSQGKWKKANGLGVGFNLEFQGLAPKGS